LDGTLLVDMLAETLEAMAFVSIAPTAPPHQFPAEATRIRIGFSGPIRGTVELATSRAFGRLLVSNVMDDVECSNCSITSADDALKELLNIVCGSLLRKQSGSDNYDISLPTASPLLADSEWERFLGSDGTIIVDAEGYLIAGRVDVLA
jgi:CheY-specific phosphatase CheX